MKYPEFLHMLIDELFLIKPYLDDLNYTANLDVSTKNVVVYIHDNDKESVVVDYLFIFSSEIENPDKQREAMALLDKYLPF